MFKTTKKKREERGRGGRDSGKGLSRAPTWNIVSQTDCTFSLKLDLNSKSCQTCAVIMLLKTLHVKQNCPACIKAETPEGRRRFVTSDLAQTRAKRAQREKIGSLHTRPSAMAASEGRRKTRVECKTEKCRATSPLVGIIGSSSSFRHDCSHATIIQDMCKIQGASQDNGNEFIYLVHRRGDHLKYI